MRLDKRKEKIDKIRGEFIGEMLFVDVLLNQVLSLYICKGKENYGVFIFNKMDFPSKLLVYNKILKDKEPAFVDYTYKGMVKDIEKMQDIRNLFAHSLADIPFYGFKDNKRVVGTNIVFRNTKKLERDMFEEIAASHEIKDIKEHLKKLDKIKSALTDVMYHYNRRPTKKAE